MAYDSADTAIRRVKCTYRDCVRSFESVKEMKLHKLAEPEHHYCKKCDVDCHDWDALTQHKVDAMAPWLEGRMKGSDESPKHIVCEFCGEDFKSFGGRKKHRSQIHQGDQSINCPGCKALFVRASHMVAHLEHGHCSSIKAHEFRGHIQQKHVLTEIMKEPDVFSQNLQVNSAFAPRTDKHKPGLVTDGTELHDQDSEGGVALLDQEDEAQTGGYQPLQAEVDLIDMSGPTAPLTRANLETWPRLPGQAPSQLSKSIRSVSASDYASEITSRRGGIMVQTESFPSLAPSSYATSTVEDDAASDVTTTAAATPASTDAANLFTARFWDPKSSDYNVERFFHSVLEQYVCPFPGCDTDPFDAPNDIEHHLLHNHTRTQFRCPACLKLFGSATALVAHCEANGKCRVQESKAFETMLNQVTGGFLKAKKIAEPRIYRKQNAVVKVGGPSIEGGVLSTLYKAKMPNEA